MQFNLTAAQTSQKLLVCGQRYSGAVELRNAGGLKSVRTNSAVIPQ